MRKKLSLLLAIFACSAAFAACEPEHVHSYDELKHDASGHWYECSCGEKSADGVVAHSGGSANCLEKAECSVCHEAYGELDASNHKSAEYKYTSNNDGTHKKIHSCCDAVEVADEACSGGSASCVEKAECEHCEASYGEFGNHVYAWDVSGSEYDVYKCTTAGCTHEDEEKKFKKVVDQRQFIVSGSTTMSLSLDGVGAYSSVVSVKLGDVDLGTSLTDISLSGITQEIGDKTISVVVKGSDEVEHTVTVPVAFITGYIETADDFMSKISARNGETSGYYVLKSNIAVTNLVSDAWNWNHFVGTFDGNGYTITSKGGVVGGIFQGLKNATIRNLTVNEAWITNNANAALLAREAVHTVFENVTINVNGGPENYTGATGANIGFLVATQFNNNTLKNFHINASGYKIGSIFGGVDTHGFGANTVEGCWIKCASLSEIGHGVAKWNGGKEGDPTVIVTQLEGFEIILDAAE